MRRRIVLAALGAAAAAPAWAEGRADTLRYVTGGAVNTLDPVMLGATQEATALGAATYDRLLRFGRIPAGDNSFVFDFDRIEGELAERFELAEDGLSITLHLRPGARWHDGSPVSAADVLWSFTRAVSAPGLARAQLATGSLTRPEQMQVLDDGTLRLSLPRPDRLALPNLATGYLPMFNSRLVRQHATAEDPWAATWLKENTAGGGAFRVESFAPGQSVVLRRNEDWANGPRPGFARAILQTVPESATRANLLERGDADIATGLAPEQLRALASSPAVRVIATPMPTGFAALVFNTQMPPFDDVAVRRALALAVPYEAIFTAAAGGRGARLFGATWSGVPPGPGFPQPLPLRSDPAAARAGLAAAGVPDGFATTLSYSVSRAGFGDTAAALIAEAFARIGVVLRIEKLPDAQLVEAVTAKRVPLLLDRSLALFPSTEYFFRVFLSGDTRWNLPSWHDGVVDALLPEARFERDGAAADTLARRLVGRLAAEVPMAPLWQPAPDIAVAQGVAGFTTWPMGYPDLRDPVRM